VELAWLRLADLVICDTSGKVYVIITLFHKYLYPLSAENLGKILPNAKPALIEFNSLLLHHWQVGFDLKII
jgi:hypothetical protein